MFFSDIHLHLLCNTDDGPKTVGDMYAMADMAYAAGTRLLCATPHFSPGHFGNNSSSAEEAFGILKEYCAAKYPDLRLCLGNELFCDGESTVWLKRGYCRTMNGTRYVLAEFPFASAERQIEKSVTALLGAGYVPIIAHAERYSKLTVKTVKKFRSYGVLIQVNARNDLKGFDFGEKLRLKRLLSKHLVDFVSSDAHNISTRIPDLNGFYRIVSQKYGSDYAEAIFRTNAEHYLTEDK